MKNVNYILNESTITIASKFGNYIGSTVDWIQTHRVEWWLSGAEGRG